MIRRNKTEQNTHVIRNYKDTVFRTLFSDKTELLGLYNAVNKTNYMNPDELIITTLDSAIYMTIKNDVSVVVDMRLSLYEQQSTVNPNMPLRNLLYVSEVYEQMIIGQDIHSRKQIILPAPYFITFYNGVETQPERKEVRLSDAFYGNQNIPNLELIVVQLNINSGCNEELKRKCPTLYQYVVFVEKIRTYAMNESLLDAIDRAINECIEEGILADFLRREKARGINMSILYEFDQELHDKTLLQEGREEGFVQGIEQGIEQGKGIALIAMVLRKVNMGKTPMTIAEELDEDPSKITRICDAIRECKKMGMICDVEHIFERLHL
ncbi:MAG: transposase [Acetatifactor sp.]|nr:transposase [Acetatifactor sp.]